MTMVWENERVALRILGDVSDEGFDPRQYEGFEVLSTAAEDVANPEKMEELGDRLAIALGQPPVEKTEEWRRKNRALHASLGAWL